MKFRKMGRLGWDVSALGFGAMRLPVKFGRINEAYATEIIKRGIDLGINYIDTAWMYHLGQSEQLLGKILQDGYREKVHLVTKLPVMLVRKAEQFDTYLAKQLEKLQTDYLDLYLFHHMTLGELEKVKRLGLMKKMEKAKEEGIIKGIGFSFHDTLPRSRRSSITRPSGTWLKFSTTTWIQACKRRQMASSMPTRKASPS